MTITVTSRAAPKPSADNAGDRVELEVTGEEYAVVLKELQAQVPDGMRLLYVRVDRG